MTHARAALALLVVFFAVIVGVRALLQARRTRDHGLRPTSLRAPPVQLFADASWGLVTIGFCAAVVFAVVDALPTVAAPPPLAVGVAVAAVGLAAAFASQLAMGASWRIGVEASERTPLVTTGPFAIVRNPIFSSVLVFLTGLALLVPNALMLATLVAAVLSVELQVRCVEEPHLRRVHGDAYAAYARRVGRFVPLVGRQRSTTT